MALIVDKQQIFLGRFISAPGPNDLLIREGAVLVSSTNGHGRIEKTSWTVRSSDEALRLFNVGNVSVIHSPMNGFFFPGFIDTHIHAPQYPNAGIFGKSTLLDWLTTYTFPLEASIGDEGPAAESAVVANGMPAEATNGQPNKKRKVEPLSRAKTVYDKVISRTLSYGTTTASYFATISVPATNVLADLAHTKGQRAYIGRVCMDHPETCPDFYRDETPEQTIGSAIESIEHIQNLDPKGNLLAPIVTPRFAPSCQAESLARLGQLAQDRNLRVQTHISENTGEVELVKTLFPDRRSYADVYDHAGLLTDRTILAHAIHLSDNEISTIVERKSKVSHCPASNSALGSGFCPVRKLLDAGIDVSLGTDVSGGYSVSMLESVRQACLVSRQLGYVNGGEKKWNIGVTEGLWLATVGGAKCVGMEGRLGGFEEGMFWDVQEIKLDDIDSAEQGVGCRGPVDIFGWENWEERVDKWVWNGDDRNVKRVWVGGRLVHERR
ncbi:hypothetical protein LTR70_000884 [Exophiala xenobiotica]|uniref:Amidohydrolase-related domain-containing protein n=1 Tax=Lithohypha guttulata TaxID=1690604 RepID=A0ABR0KK85_9EURO|nr:hypothetical protein LTR24_001623 [Lithohypha guttulata]KAK5329048.1 hypothetical protein LTR70_000884 [Exophiala xenobiotica]